MVFHIYWFRNRIFKLTHRGPIPISWQSILLEDSHAVPKRQLIYDRNSLQHSTHALFFHDWLLSKREYNGHEALRQALSCSTNHRTRTYWSQVSSSPKHKLSHPKRPSSSSPKHGQGVRTKLFSPKSQNSRPFRFLWTPRNHAQVTMLISMKRYMTHRSQKRRIPSALTLPLRPLFWTTPGIWNPCSTMRT